MGAYEADAYFPVGGPARFAETLLPAVSSTDGECRLGTEVRRILMDGGRACGVEISRDGLTSIERTSCVISDIGVADTLECLVNAVAATAWRDEGGKLEPGLGFVALCLGLEGDIAAAGATSANHWICEDVDIGRAWQRPADEDAPGVFVGFPSLKELAWRGPPTAQVSALAERSAFAPWLNNADASEDDQAFKDWIAERQLAQFKRHFPALAPMVRFCEAATPPTQQRFVRAVGGSMYGIEMTTERLRSGALRLCTLVPGLLLTGQDVAGPGVQAAFMAGLLAAATVDAGLWREMGR